MQNTYFKLIGQKTAGKLVLIAVVDENLFGDVPSIFELQAIKLVPTIYSGTYPTIKLNMDTIKDVTKQLTGWVYPG